MDELIKNVAQEERQSKQDKVPFEEAKFRQLWKEHFDSIGSKTVSEALKNLIFEIAKTTINVIVPNERIKDLFVEEKGFSDQVDLVFLEEDLVMTPIIDMSRFPEYEENLKVRTPMTATQRYQYLRVKNPDLDHLMEALDLKLEQ